MVPVWPLPVAYSVSFFHPRDKRPVFVFPWGGVSVIGTTDLDHREDASQEASIGQVELDYLLEAVNVQFPQAKLCPEDVRATWSGVRPVVSKQANKPIHAGQSLKPSDEKREHAIWEDKGMISVAGGKLTTYRLIARDVLQKAAPFLGVPASRFDQTSHFEVGACKENVHVPLSSESKKRLTGRYGTQICETADWLTHLPELGEKIQTTDTLWLELVWACQHEQIVHLDDLLLRRTRIGLLLEKGGEAILPKVKLLCAPSLGWDEARWTLEIQRYQEIIKRHYALPESI